MELNKNILIFPAGTEIAFTIVNALKYSRFVTIYGGTSVKDHSEFVYKNLIEGFPFVDDDNFLEYLNDVVEKYKIDCIYPTHDSVCLFLSERMQDIKAQVIITGYETTRICRSKKQTYLYLDGEKYIPKFYKNLEDVNEYPVFVKPSVGQGSKGAIKIESRHQLEVAQARDPSLVICEYLPGMEYTVDCFTDRYGKLRVVKLRDRQRIRVGISVRSHELPVEDDVMEIAVSLNSRLSFRGAWFFQLKKNNAGSYILMEVSPRIPGTVGLSKNLGINFPLLTLYDFWGFDIDIVENSYDIIVDRAFYSTYKIDYQYDYVYIDFDDTLVIKGKVNELIIFFVYQCINKEKHIILISKHDGNLKEDLEKARIRESLFDKIICLDKDEEKSAYINKFPSIFIDDSFSERKKISRTCHIPVFDVDMVECLIDWRC